MDRILRESVSKGMHSLDRRTLLLAVPAAARVLGQTPSIPATPAGHVLGAWIAAVNSGNRDAIAAYCKRHEPEAGDDHVGMLLGIHARFGGFDLHQIERAEPGEIAAILTARKGGERLRFWLQVEDGDPPVVSGANLSPLNREETRPKPARVSFEEAVRLVDAHAAAEAAADRFSGALLIARDGKVVLEKAWGLADRESKVPNTVDTRFRIGSMNKMFTAVATLQLVERKQIALDAPLARYLAGYPNRDLASKVTIRHLLTHTGGTGDIFGRQFDENRLQLRTHADYLKLYGERPLRFEPGSRWAYSNYGFVLLGAVIEQVTGQSYYDFVQNSVFAPAGMTRTGSEPESVAVEGRARGYMRKDGLWVSNADTLPWRGTAAGGGYSTVGDLFRFGLALHSGKLLARSLRDQALSPQAKTPRPGTAYGYGFMVEEGDMPRFGHGGGAPGMNGELFIFPATGVLVAALSNFDPPAASSLAGFFADRMPLA
jgi:D-alanyl-D-alanine carboxypeptidase